MSSSLTERGNRTQVAERVGFEPTDEQAHHLISSQARSTGLRHLSARADDRRPASAPASWRRGRASEGGRPGWGRSA